jgi:hypothetical protein
MKHITLAALVIACTPALAQTPLPARTVDMTTVLVDMNGAPLSDGSKVVIGPDGKADCSKCGSLTLGAAVATALLTDRRDEQNLPAIDKAKRGALALKIMDDKASVLNPVQIEEIKRLLVIWSPLVLTRALPLIDPTVKLDE